MSILRSAVLEPIPDNAPYLYVVTKGPDPKIKTYRLSHETARSYRVYRTFGDDDTRHAGLETLMHHNLEQWGHKVFTSRSDAVSHQRRILEAEIEALYQASQNARARLDAHIEKWGKV